MLTPKSKTISSYSTDVNNISIDHVFNPSVRSNPHWRKYVVLLHGWMGSSQDMMPISEGLAHSGYYVLSVDLPYHARSNNVQPTSPQDAAVSILAALSTTLSNLKNKTQASSGDDPLHVKNDVSIIGYSLGGRLALEMYNFYSTNHTGFPDFNLAALVLMSCAPAIPASSTDTKEIFLQISELNAKKLLNLFTPEAFQNWLRHDWYKALIWGSLTKVSGFQKLLDVRTSSFSTSIHQPTLWAQASVRLGRAFMTECPRQSNIELSVLYICGEQDVKYRQFTNQFQELFPTLEVCVVQDAGHNVLFQSQEFVVQTILSFLAFVPYSSCKEFHKTFSLRALSSIPYSLTLRTPMSVNEHTVSSRTGFLVTLATDDGVQGVGDVCPLPGFHSTLLETCQSEVDNISDEWFEKCGLIERRRLCTHCIDLRSFNVLFNGLSSVTRNGLECALVHVISRVLGKDVRSTIFDLLSKELRTSYNIDNNGRNAEVFEKLNGISDFIHVNGVFPRKPSPMKNMQEIGGFIPQNISQAVIATPFEVLKLKVGASSDVQDDVDTVIAAARTCARAGKTLRLDANRAWDIQRYRAFLRAIVDSKDCLSTIEYIEEPLQNSSELRKLLVTPDKKHYDHVLPVALDESLDEYFAMKGSDTQIADLVSEGKFKLVLSSVFDSGVGLVWTSILAGVCKLFNSKEPDDLTHSTEIHHGLGTHTHLVDDVVSPGFTQFCTYDAGTKVSLKQCELFLAQAAKGSTVDEINKPVSK